MATSGRKSSLSNGRRGPQKAHIPYRGDNPEVGKKTGIAVQHVERKSDGFELFEELIQTADGFEPPQRKGRRKSLAERRQRDIDYDDEDGEQSMQLDSPVQHLVNVRPPVTPPTVGRRSSIRPVARTSDVDFDAIPSPHQISTARSVRNGGPGPSSLSQSRSQREPSSDSSNEEAGSYDYGGGGEQDQSTFDDYAPQDVIEPPEDDAPAETSFTQINQQDDDDDDELQMEGDREETPRLRRHEKGKGKERGHPPRADQQDEEAEDDIAQGLKSVELEPESDASQEGRPAKKSKKEVEKGERRTKSRSKKENKPRREGTRRSQRKPLKPLAYWRGEKYVYGKRGENLGPVLVPLIKEVIRIPEEPPVPLGTKRKRRTSKTRSKSRGVEADEDVIPPALPVENPEEGWDDNTESKCVVLQYTTLDEVERRIAWTEKMVNPKLSIDGTWLFDKIFGDDDFVAAGQLVIPPKGRKPSKPARDNTYIFYVIEGAVNFKIHDTSMVLATGGMFMVPRGNAYFIENICNRDARLFFTQARKLEPNETEKLAKKAEIEAQRRLAGRSSSVGASGTPRRPEPNGRAASLDALSTANA